MHSSPGLAAVKDREMADVGNTELSLFVSMIGNLCTAESAVGHIEFVMNTA